MWSCRKCAFRCVTFVLLTLVLSSDRSLAQELITKSPRVAGVCLNGSYNDKGECVCNPGYSLYNGNCFLQHVSGSTSPNNICPPGMALWNGVCHFRVLPPIADVVPPQEKLIVVPPLRIEIPTPELIDPLDPNHVPEESEGDDSEPEVIAPGHGHKLNLNFEKIVSNHNVVNNATTVHTHNQNNVVVHFTRRLSGGGIRTVIVRNNETTVYDDRDQRSTTEKNPSLEDASQDTNCTESNADDQSTTTTQVPGVRELPCCTVVSPRVCRKQEQDEWVCFHRKQYVCSTVCTANVMYLRPRKPSYRKPWLIMPPLPNPFAKFKQCRWGRCPRPDCSGCVDGKDPCHPWCSTYDCMVDNSCHFIDRTLECPDPSNDLCVLLEQKTIDLVIPTGNDAGE